MLKLAMLSFYCQVRKIWFHFWDYEILAILMVSCLTCKVGWVPISAATDALGSLLSCFAHGESRPGIAARGSRALWLLEIHWGGVIFGADDDFVGATVGVTNLGMFFLMVPLLMPYMRWPIRLEILYYISTSLIHIDWREFQRGSGVDLLQ